MKFNVFVWCFFLEGNSIILFSDNLKLIMVEEFII